ncbi:hypothetical protein MPER_11724 [Moniliophthora perniciosa FA553]|nr:hypothetical protein MPER_11724 [Moniliophthora perniciosa FA553]
MSVSNTAAAQRVLEDLMHGNNFFDTMGKLTPYDYYRSLEKLTDNSGSYNFKALKRGGRGNDGKRPVSETLPGELAVQCPACPKPSVNLPKDWENVTESRKMVIYGGEYTVS